VIIHAGPEIDGIGRTALDLADRFQGARLALGHDALTDLSWIYEEVDAHPNVFFDTSWWGPGHTDELETPNQYGPGWDLIAAAALVARTPDAPLSESG
jgi:hypothetical protein